MILPRLSNLSIYFKGDNKNINLRITAHDQISELDDLVVDRGSIPLLNDVVSCPPLTLLHYPSWPDSSRCHLALIHAWPSCALTRAWLYLFDWQLISSSHHNRDSGQDVAAHKCLANENIHKNSF